MVGVLEAKEGDGWWCDESWYQVEDEWVFGVEGKGS